MSTGMSSRSWHARAHLVIATFVLIHSSRVLSRCMPRLQGSPLRLACSADCPLAYRRSPLDSPSLLLGIHQLSKHHACLSISVPLPIRFPLLPSLQSHEHRHILAVAIFVLLTHHACPTAACQGCHCSRPRPPANRAGSPSRCVAESERAARHDWRRAVHQGNGCSLGICGFSI